MRWSLGPAPLWSSGCWLPLASLDFWVKVYVNAVGRQTSAIQHIPLRGTCWERTPKAPMQLVTSEGASILIASPMMATMGTKGDRSTLQFHSAFNTRLCLPVLHFCCSLMLRICPWPCSALRETSCFLSVSGVSLPMLNG